MAIVKYLPREEFDLTVCALRVGSDVNAGAKLRELGVKYTVARFRPRGKKLRHFWKSLKEQKEINQLGPFHIQHSLDFSSLPFEAIVARSCSRVFILSQRNMNEDGHRTPLRLKLLLSNKVVAISESVNSFLLHQGVPATKIRKILNGIDLMEVDEEIGNGNFEQTKNIICAGHICSRKRQDLAIRTLSLLKDSCPTTRLLIVGSVYDQSFQEELVKLVQAMGLSERVSFLGSYNNPDLLRLMRGAGAILHCAESEAFGWVIVEAMSVGVPIIASYVDGPGEILRHGQTGLLVPHENIHGYASSIERVLSDRKFRETITVNARKDVERHYSAKVMVDQLAEVYREAACNNR